MSTDAPREFPAAIKELGDKIVQLTLKEAKDLSDYLEEVHGIKAAAGGAVVVAAAGGADAAPAVEEKTEFDVVLEDFGAEKIKVIKIVRDLTGAGLADAKKMVEDVPSKIKTGISKEEAAKIKAQFEEVGAKASVK
ncbi:MAG: 50S ribosomal protein L7/L12 [Planctomycetaceae bacterium]|jgi:large subunit ribosomal protein L7/L12|nr:50S ribosomal protein L7/L12 [Planctomycetaceae bacterium]